MERPSNTNTLALALFFELAGWIAFPVIAAMLLGNWLDGKFHTEPTLMLICIGIAFIVTIAGLVRKGRKLMKKTSGDNKKEDKDENI